nr:sigma-70 family RNA polymerase sigma factor [Streptoalloteichus tenebrarius]
MTWDHARFTQLYLDTHQRVLRYALRRVAPEDARDVVADTYVIAWQRRSQLPSNPLPRLLRTTHNRIGNLLRRAATRDALQATLEQLRGLEPPAADVSVLERLAVLEALNRLTELEREAMLLVAWDGLSSREAATVLDRSAATFAVRLHRARRRFSNHLEQLDVELSGGLQLCGSAAARGHA